MQTIHLFLIQRHAAIIAQVRLAQLEESFTERNPGKVTLATSIRYAEHGRDLDFQWTPGMSLASKDILVFLSHFRWEPVDGRATQGITWVELLALFQIMGGNLFKYDAAYDADFNAHANLRNLLSIFKKRRSNSLSQEI